MTIFQELNTYFDSREIPNGNVINCDVCIIGGGAAGIAVAKEFAGTNTKVCLLESGGFSFEENIDELNNYEIIGHRYGNDTRLRILVVVLIIGADIVLQCVQMLLKNVNGFLAVVAHWH